MLRTQLKSKIHLARITDANVDYEGSISIPEDLMQAVDLWPGEKVLVASRDTGARVETYVFPAPAGSAAVLMNGAAARLVHKGDRVTIMAFGMSEKPIRAKRVLLNERNEVVRSESGVGRATLPPEPLTLL
ncbi:MAG: aspartate 1-decarboxylase [Planctomycetes bacterium]|nr:aspartate 1-decarboxylase [Planctomycetota bacterium]